MAETSLKKSLLVLLGLLVVCVGGGAMIGIVTAGNIEGWYDTLNKPSWTPPNFLFGPVWTLLYAMMAVAMWLVWQSGTSRGNSIRAAAISFAIQLVLNFLWTPVFFGAHQMEAALVIIVALVIAVAVTIVLFKRHRPLAGWLLVPYLCWVIYATTLNAGFLWLNQR